jgi:hypothetical protein
MSKNTNTKKSYVIAPDVQNTLDRELTLDYCWFWIEQSGDWYLEHRKDDILKMETDDDDDDEALWALASSFQESVKEWAEIGEDVAADWDRINFSWGTLVLCSWLKKELGMTSDSGSDSGYDSDSDDPIPIT